MQTTTFWSKYMAEFWFGCPGIYVQAAFLKSPPYFLDFPKPTYFVSEPPQTTFYSLCITSFSFKRDSHKLRNQGPKWKRSFYSICTAFSNAFFLMAHYLSAKILLLLCFDLNAFQFKINRRIPFQRRKFEKLLFIFLNKRIVAVILKQIKIKNKKQVEKKVEYFKNFS